MLSGIVSGHMVSGIVYRINCSQCDFVYFGQTKRALKTRISEQKKAVLMFVHNSKLSCHIHEDHHHMDFENVGVVGHEAHYHQRLFSGGLDVCKRPECWQ